MFGSGHFCALIIYSIGVESIFGLGHLFARPAIRPSMPIFCDNIFLLSGGQRDFNKNDTNINHMNAKY